MAKRLPPRDQRGRFVKRQPTPLPRAIVQNLRRFDVALTEHERNVLELPKHEIINLEDL